MAGEFLVGDVRIRPELLCFERDGQEVPVEPKVMDALVFLASRPGETVSRAAMMAELWPDLHVSEDALNRCIWKLRRALGDDRESPRFVATIQKRGYRLVAPVVRDVPPGARSGPLISKVSPPAESGAASHEAPGPPPTRRLALGLAVSLVTVAAVLAAAGVGRRILSGDSGATEAALVPSIVPFTSLDGYESAPAITADGRMVAFVHSRHGGGQSNQLDLLIQASDGQTEPVPLTDTPGNEYFPAWSPDGTRLAFTRWDHGRCDVVLMRLPERTESLVTPCDATIPSGVAWSPDGDALFLAERDQPGEPSRIVRLSLGDGSRRALTAPPHQDAGDRAPAVSPDGRTIAFARTRTGEVADVYVMPVDGGSARRVTFDASSISGLAWSSHGHEIVYASNRLGPYRLWSVAAGGGAPRLVPTIGNNASAPATARDRSIMVYEEWQSTIDVRRATLRTSESEPVEYDASPLVTSTQWDTDARWSPDGSRLAFLSDRQGSTEVWLADGQGGSARRMTSFGIRFSSWLRWSPDGTRVALSVPVGEQFDVHVLNVWTGTVTRVTADASDERWPAWSLDGHALYFGSNRSGRWEIWRSSDAGGAAALVTADGGLAPAPSDDGRWLYYVKADAPGLWRRGLKDDSLETLMVGAMPPGQITWDVHGAAVYIVETPPDGLPSLARYDLATGSRRIVARLALADGRYPEWFPSGIAISPDGRSVAFGSIENSGSDLWLQRPPAAGADGERHHFLTGPPAPDE